MPLLVAERATDELRALIGDESAIVTWAWTRIEITSAVERRAREGALDRSERRNILDRLDAFADAWDEVADLLAVRVRAASLLARHALRAADAGQLAAALLVAEGSTARLGFVCLDDRLNTAADVEGLDVLIAAG